MSGWLSAGLGWANSAEGWIALGTLTVLEIVLGIDNIVFISILAGKLRLDSFRRWPVPDRQEHLGDSRKA